MIVENKKEANSLRIAGKILARALQMLKKHVHSGQTTAALDLLAEEYIRREGGVPSFLGYQPRGARIPFPAVLCVSINDEVVHGIPSEKRKVKEEDIISLDLGLSYNGFYVDSAFTMFVGQADRRSKRLIDATQEATEAGIAATRVGGHIGDIGAAIKEVANKYQYAIVQDLGGHAVGGAVHEKPFIPNEGIAGEGEIIRSGMVLAIEPMFSEGSGEIVLAEDDWTYLMEDGSRAAHFEHTILVSEEGVEILTR